MNHHFKAFFIPGKLYLLLLAGSILSVCFTDCKQKTSPEEKVIVEIPEKMDDKVQGLIREFIRYAAGNNSRLDDSTALHQLPALFNI
jgi:hypothetical protein